MRELGKEDRGQTTDDRIQQEETETGRDGETAIKGKTTGVSSSRLQVPSWDKLWAEVFRITYNG
jgi:hypothetical protein